MTIFLAHDKTKLAFHTVRDGEGPALLLLHALGESSPRTVGPDLRPAGLRPYGSSISLATVSPRYLGGGGYTAEILMGDADCALAVLGSATLVGRGLAPISRYSSPGPAPARCAALCFVTGLASLAAATAPVP